MIEHEAETGEGTEFPPLESLLADPVLAREFAIKGLVRQLANINRMIDAAHEGNDFFNELDDTLARQEREKVKARVEAGDSDAITALAEIEWFYRAAELGLSDEIERAAQSAPHRYWLPRLVQRRQ